MRKKLTGILIIMSLLVVSCKKDSNPVVKNTSSHMLDFKASAPTTLQVAITVIRPTGLTSGVTGEEIAGAGSNNVVSPYEFKSAKIQPGDNVYIEVYTIANHPVTSSLTIDGKSVPYTTVVNNAVWFGYTWNFDVK